MLHDISRISEIMIPSSIAANLKNLYFVVTWNDCLLSRGEHCCWSFFVKDQILSQFTFHGYGCGNERVYLLIPSNRATMQ